MRLSGLLLCLVATIMAAQLPYQGAQAAYEGETVTAIDLVANPHVDLKPFESLLIQKSGQPYSQEKVEASVAALEKTEKFGAIRLQVNPESNGVRLSFILEPAYYIGIVSFPEAARYFSYIRLLQVADLPDQAPYDQARIPEAKVALENFFRKNGYFEAKVEPEVQLDDVNQLANVTFRVHLGPHAKIGQVRLDGVPASETARVMHAVQSLWARLDGGLLKPGRPYTRSRMEDATKLIKRALSKQTYIASQVKENPPLYHADTKKVDVSYRIDVGPRVSINITGAKLTVLPFTKAREARKLIPVYSEGSIDQELVDEGQQNLLDYYQKKGYFDVKVTTRFEQQPEYVSLTYQVDRGRKHKVDRIIFEGNPHVADKKLLAAIPIKKSHIWTHGAYSDKLAKTSVKNIEAVYRDAGYEDVKVTARVVDHEPKIDVIFNVDEGPQTLVANIEIHGNKSVPSEQLAPGGFQLRTGAPFSPGKLASDRNRISATYLERGYLNSEVKAVVTREGDDRTRVNVAYNVTENQLVRVNRVLYLGRLHTRLSLLKKATTLATEQPLSQGRLLQSQSQLYDLQIFDWASVGPRKPIESQEDESVLVKVHEAKRTEITYGFGFEVSHRGGSIPAGTVAVPGLPPISIGNQQVASSQATYASPRGSIELIRRNMRGQAETASFSLLASRLDQRAVASYADPNFRLTNWDGLTSLSFERTTENPLFAAQLTDGSFQLERVLNKKTNKRIQFRYEFNHTTLSQLLVPALVEPRDRDVELSTFSGTFIRDTRDKPLDAHHGSFTTVDFGITPTALGSSANFNRLFAQYAFYKPAHGMVIANSLRLGLAKAFSGSFVPTSELFFAGGGTTLRGFPIDEAGPQRLVPFCNVLTGTTGCVNITVPVGGRQLFILNSELRFPLKIFSALGGVVFYDGGNVYSAINLNQFVNNYSNTVGIGLRYATPIGPIRIDLGRNLNPVPGISATQYFITLGQAF
jgi:outer membrane protein insertion porin family